MEVTEPKALLPVYATYQCEVHGAQEEPLYFAVGAGQTPASKEYIHLTLLHHNTFCYYACDTSSLQYWSNYLKLLMETLWLCPLNWFLKKGSEDTLWGQAFCQVSYAPMAGLPWRRGLQHLPQHSSSENLGKQTNGSIFWCPMCHCSPPFQYSVSSAWGIKEGGCLWINTTPMWTNTGHGVAWPPWKLLLLRKNTRNMLNLKCISTYVGVVGFADLGRGQGPLPHDNCRYCLHNVPKPCPPGKRNSMWKSLLGLRGWETTVLKSKLKHIEVNIDEYRCWITPLAHN